MLLGINLAQPDSALRVPKPRLVSNLFCALFLQGAEAHLSHLRTMFHAETTR